MAAPPRTAGILPARTVPSREHVAALLKERQARLARERGWWRFWRWRPKCSLCTFQLGALLTGSIVLLCMHWDPWALKCSLIGHTGAINSVTFSPDGEQVLSASDDKTARLWNLGNTEPKLELPHPEPVLSAAISPDGRTALTINESDMPRVWNVSTGEFQGMMFNFRGPSGTRRPPGRWRPGVFSVSGKAIVASSTDGYLELYDLENRTQLYDTIVVPAQSLCSAFLSARGDRIISATMEGYVQVTDVKTRAVLARLHGDSDRFQNASFSSDGKRIVTTGKDSAVRLWEAVCDGGKKSLLDSTLEPGQIKVWKAERIALMKGHRQYVVSAQFSPDGERIVTVSLDGMVRIWNGHSGAPIATLADHGPLRTAVFSPDGSRVVAGGTDGVLRVWERRRPESLLGLLAFPPFWLMLLFFPAVVWSIRRDRRSFARAAADAERRLQAGKMPALG